jgi:homoserine kinase
VIATRPAGVRVPCSTSNLGAGFDAIGLALDRYLTAGFEPGGGGLIVRRTGTLAGLQERDQDDLLVAAFSAVMAQAAVDVCGVLEVHSEIPVARGLGSSAAALVAGHELARAVLGLEMAAEEAFQVAARCEGHGDNAAPCALGGLQGVTPDPSGTRAVRLELSPDIGFAYAAPTSGVSTKVARAGFPRHVEHATAVAALSRLVALIRGLALGDAGLIHAGFQDELHVPYRLPLIPGAYNAVAAGYEAGAWAVTISGAGSGLLAACAPGIAGDVAQAMRAVFAAGADDPECVGFVLTPDLEGVRRT